MDSKEIPKPPSNNQPQLQLQLTPGMVMNYYQNLNAAGIMDPTSTSQSIQQQQQQQHNPPQSQQPQTLHQQQQQHNPPQSQLPQTLHQQQQQQPQMGQNGKKRKTLDSLGFGDGSSSSQPTRGGIEQNQSQNQQQQQPKKRGRPRKYPPIGNIAFGGGGDAGGGGGYANPADPSANRRGRPLGSCNKQRDTLGGTAGVGFTPHVVEVKIGEDIASKVMNFWGEGPRSICILSASGGVSKATLKQASLSSGIVVTYEGQFDIITLSGSFLNHEVDGSTYKIGSLCVALAGPEGRTVGGSVAGLLVAATPVQVIVGSFVAAEANKPLQSSGNNAQCQNPEPASAAANMLNSGSISQGPSGPSWPSSESSEGNESSSPTFHQQQQQQQQPLRPDQMQKLELWPNRGWPTL